MAMEDGNLEDEFEVDMTIHRAEDVMRLVAANFNENEEAAKEVLVRYGIEDLLFDETPVFGMLSASLAINSYLVDSIAQMLQVSPEHIIDEIMLELI